MTVASTTNRKSFSGDGVTTSFGTSPVVFYTASDLVVEVYSSTGAVTTLVNNTDYSVSGGSTTGAVGTVNLAGGSSPYGAPAVGETLLIRRVLPLVQEADFLNNDINDAEVSETALDKLTMIAQQISETSGRGVAIPAVETATDALIVLPFDRASKFLAFDANKEMIASDGPAGDNVPVSTFMATVLDDTDGPTACATLGAISNTLVDAKGDLIVGTAADTPARKAVGTNGHPLVADSSASDGLSWNIAKMGVQGSDIASASTIDLDAATGDVVDVTGTTTITAITLSQGRKRIVRFTGALTLTHGASLVLPGSQNITTAAGDYAVFVGYASSVVRCMQYQKASPLPYWTRATPVSFSGSVSTISGIPASVNEILVCINGLSTNGSSIPIIQIGDSGGLENSGYVGSVILSQNAISPTVAQYAGSGFMLGSSWAANAILTGVVVLTRYNGNRWMVSGNLGREDVATTHQTAGAKTLTDTLTQVSIAPTNGTDSFDAGDWTILYR